MRLSTLLPAFLSPLLLAVAGARSTLSDGGELSPTLSSSLFPASLATLTPRLRPSDLEISPLLLVSTIDGSLHALERETGKKVWSVDGLGGVDGFAMVGTDGDETEELEEGEEEERFLVDPRKGEIWLGTRAWKEGDKEDGGWGLIKLGVTVPDLVHASFQASPVQFAHDPNPSRIFIGKMESNLFGIELDTGNIVGEFGRTAGGAQTVDSVVPSSCGVKTRGLGRRRRKSSGETDLDAAEIEALLDEMEAGHSTHAESCPQNLLYITRTDYTLRIHSTNSFHLRTTQTLRYSTYGPPDPARLDSSLTSIWGQGATADSQYAMLATRWSAGDRKLSAGVLGILAEGDGPRFWGVEMPDSLPIAFFDILSLRTTGLSSSAPFILPQPLPSTSLLKLSPPSSAPKVLFVGRSSTSSLFALFKDNYPALGDPDVSPSQGRRHELEGYHYLEADSEEVLGRGNKRLGIDGPVPVGSDLNASRELDVVEEDPLDLEGVDPTPSSRSWLVHVFVIYLPLLLVGLTGIWKFLGSSIALPSSLAFSTPATQQRTPLLPPFDTKPISLSSTHASKIPSPTTENGSGSSFDNTLKDLPPLPDLEDEEGGRLGELEAGMAGAGAKTGKKKRRGKIRGKKKGKGGDDDDSDGEGEDPGADKESVAIVASAREAIVVEPTVAVQDGGLVVSDKLLGVGSHGTMVFEGTFQSRPVAVKRLLSHFTTLASHEVSLLQSTDFHPNIVRYFYEEKRDPWLYIALELCPASLQDIIERPAEFPELASLFEPQAALKGIVQGVRHLHELKVCHRDIKPGNILVSKTHSNRLKMLISDFGLAKRVPVDQSSYGATIPTPSSATMMPSGTPGWRAPEVLLRRGSESDTSGDSDDFGWEIVGEGGANGNGRGGAAKKPTSKRLTSAVDVFALGCVFYWVLTAGEHPFGDRYEREGNICRNRSSLSGLLNHGEEGQEARHLVEQMIRPESAERPSTSNILLHPYFWSPGRRLAFLQDASDSFEILERDPPDPLLVALELGSSKVIGPARDWIKPMDQGFVESLGKYRKYDVSSLRDLLRALRNKKHHFMDLPPAAREAMSPLPEGFLSYFTTRFPLLFLYVYSVVASTSMRDDSTFRDYFVEDGRG